MLTALLEILESRQGEIDQHQLCADLGISPDTLQNLLDLLVRKGRINSPQMAASACCPAKNCLSTGKTCPGPEACELVMLAPKQIKITLREPPAKP